MTVWLLCDDSELRELVVSVAQQANLPVRHSDASDAKRELQNGAQPNGLLATGDLLGDEDLRALLGSVRRVIVASSAAPDGLSDTTHPVPLRLPTSLSRLEAALRWLAYGEGAGGPSPASESSSANA